MSEYHILVLSAMMNRASLGRFQPSQHVHAVNQIFQIPIQTIGHFLQKTNYFMLSAFRILIELLENIYIDFVLCLN